MIIFQKEIKNSELGFLKSSVSHRSNVHFPVLMQAASDTEQAHFSSTQGNRWYYITGLCLWTCCRQTTLWTLL